MSTNPYEPPKAPIGEYVPADECPALWNPSAAARWSLVFSPVFGAMVQMKNWSALGEPEKAGSSKRWALVSLVLLTATIAISVIVPESQPIDLLSRFLGLGLLIAWYYKSGKDQIRYVSDRFGKDYPRREWGKPLLIATIATLALVGLCVVLGVIAGIASPPLAEG